MMLAKIGTLKALGVTLVALFACGVALAEPAAGTIWTEPNTGMEFVWVPGGCLTIGSTEGRSNEQPVHQACVKGFYIGKYEVTQAQYEKATGKNPSRFKGANRPVEQIDWTSASEAAAALGAKDGFQLRLPSEAEWEYACRAGGQHDRSCGAGDLSDLAWYEDNSNDVTHDVGGKRPNAWGLYDMNGSVWEWTQDCYHDSYVGAPTDGSAWTAGDCDRRVTRGGGWNRDAFRTRPDYRGGDGSTHRDDNIGFRLARSGP